MILHFAITVTLFYVVILIYLSPVLSCLPSGSPFASPVYHGEYSSRAPCIKRGHCHFVLHFHFHQDADQ